MYRSFKNLLSWAGYRTTYKDLQSNLVEKNDAFLALI